MYRTVSDGEGTMVVIPAYGTKVCPRCGAGLFADMDVCYECLNEFAPERDGVSQSLDAREGELVPAEAYEDLAQERTDGCDAALYVHVSTKELDMSAPLPARGLLVGRGSACDIMLHAEQVSRRHVRIEPEEGGALARDLDATNPARLGGRPIAGSMHLAVGDELEVCGATIRLELAASSVS
ncbi:MAG: FHA domain-containing protein [Coriobacteriales bacterium]|nr:FHA domain-containing protein [Coriobacteriales bacterium]